MKKYKFLEHTADIKFQAFGKTLEEVFENSALALISIMCKKKIKSVVKKQISVKGKDLESLLYNFLEEFLFLSETEMFLSAKINNLKISEGDRGYKLDCECIGDINRNNYEIETHVKAITYNEMFVKKKSDKFICQVVVDV